jgi:prolyl oligopeptidase
MRTRLPVIAIASVVAIARAVAAPSADNGPAREDPFVWLEQVDGERAMAWVRAENAKTAAVLEQDAVYPGLFKEALELAEAKDRIPEPQLIGGRILNRWQDADHVRGIWRWTSLADYQKTAPAKDDDADVKGNGSTRRMR